MDVVYSDPKDSKLYQVPGAEPRPETEDVIYKGGNSSDVFTNLFHDFFPHIFLSFEQLKENPNFLLIPKRFFFQFANWKRNHNKYSLKNRRLGIRDWWKHLMNSLKVYASSGQEKMYCRPYITMKHSPPLITQTTGRNPHLTTIGGPWYFW